MKHFLIFAPIVFLIGACGQNPNQQIDEGQINSETYKSEEIGWSIKIPTGWTVVRPDTERGEEAMEETTGGEIDFAGLKQLISFKKDASNSFASTSEPFTEEYPGEFLENNKLINKLIYDTYSNQGIKADTSSGTASIDGLEFAKLEIKIYSKDGDLILNQILYSRLMNGLQFGVNINFNNDQDRDVLLAVLMDSKFDKR